MRDHKLKRWYPDSALAQCTVTIAQGQCPYEAEPNCSTCSRHKSASEDKSRARRYSLTMLRLQYEAFANDPGIKNLRDEIALARLTLQNILQKCEFEAAGNPEALPTLVYIHHEPISRLLGQIQRLVESCHKIEQQTQLYLDYQQIIAMVGSFIQVIESANLPPDATHSLIVQIEDRLLDMARSPATDQN